MPGPACLAAGCPSRRASTRGFPICRGAAAGAGSTRSLTWPGCAASTTPARRSWWRRRRCRARRAGIREPDLWPRGVDTELFRPHRRGAARLPRPVFLYVGRVAVEKNIEAFLALDLPGSKVVVGDGPARDALSGSSPRRRLLGLQARRWPSIYAGADVFVFPSRTDTFGLVLLEALACGLPVAAFRHRAARRDRGSRGRRARGGSSARLPCGR